MRDRILRRSFVAATSAGLAGCLSDEEVMATGTTEAGTMEGATDDDTGSGDEGTATTDEAESENPAVGDAEQRGDLSLSSSAFEDGAAIPQQYAREGENANPPLTVESVPSDAASLTLIVDDPDAVEPAGEVWLHWLVWNVPPSTTEIPADWEPEDAVEGENDFGNRGYDGPAPPDEEHTYRFKLYALGTTLSVSESANKREVGEAMADDVLAVTQLTGTYVP